MHDNHETNNWKHENMKSINNMKYSKIALRFCIKIQRFFQITLLQTLSVELWLLKKQKNHINRKNQISKSFNIK